jgi:hypothetical protein
VRIVEMGRPRSVTTSGGLLRVMAAAACAVLALASIAGCGEKQSTPDVWGATLVNDSDAAYLVASHGNQTAIAAPAHARINLGGSSVGHPIDLVVYSSDCQKAGTLTLSNEEPGAYIDEAGGFSTLGPDDVYQAMQQVPGAPTVWGFTCAPDRWQVAVRNDLATNVRLRVVDALRDQWLLIGAGKRVLLIAGFEGPFPDGQSVDVYSDDCRPLGTVHPTFDRSAVYVGATGDVSIGDMSGFWQGLTATNLRSPQVIQSAEGCSGSAAT